VIQCGLPNIAFYYVIHQQHFILGYTPPHGPFPQRNPDRCYTARHLGPELPFAFVHQPKTAMLRLGQITRELGVQPHQLFQLLRAADQRSMLKDGSRNPVSLGWQLPCGCAHGCPQSAAPYHAGRSAEKGPMPAKK
jgi:hypothetical protein